MRTNLDVNRRKPEKSDGGSGERFYTTHPGQRPSQAPWLSTYLNGTPLAVSGPLPDQTPLLVNFAGCGLGWRPVPQATDLTIRNVRPEHGGDYFVVFTNGLERMTSAVAPVTVNSTSTPPRIDCPADVIWFPTADGKARRRISLFRCSKGPRSRYSHGALSAAGVPVEVRSPDGTSFFDLHGNKSRLNRIAGG